MKIHIFSVLILFLVLSPSQLLADSTDPKCATFVKKTSFNINPVVDAPQCVQGKVEVVGRFNSVSSKKEGLMLIDLSEEDNCEDGFPIKRMPVSWNGKLPSKGENVVVSGKLNQQNDQYIFAAETLKLLPKKALK